jgi:hypothetical protein
VGEKKTGSGTGSPRKLVPSDTFATGTLIRGRKRRKEKEFAVARKLSPSSAQEEK